MQAVQFDRYGPIEVLRLREIPEPAPKRRRVRVKVHAAALNPKDLLLRKGRFRMLSGWRFPQGVGFDFAGEVIDGPRYQPGTRVWGMLDGWRGATVAGVVSVRLRELAPMPAKLSYTEAAALPLVGLTALQALRDLARLRPDERILINGASGGLGLVALQIAKLFGAHLSSLSSAGNQALCRRHGADVAMDYRSDDPWSRPESFDIVFDVFGNRSLADARNCLRPGGRYITTVPSARNFLDQALFRYSSRARARLVIVRPASADLRQLAAWVDQDQLKPVVDRVIAVDEVADGQRYLETRRARGKVVVRL